MATKGSKQKTNKDSNAEQVENSKENISNQDNKTNSNTLDNSKNAENVADSSLASSNKETSGDSDDSEENGMYVVGVGASAGGVEALQTLFRKMPDNTGVAFVVVQHLSPDYKSYMSSLLARCTMMPVLQATNGMTIEPNTVYLNTPSCNLQIVNNKFEVNLIEKTDSINLPIDILFRSMASALGKYAIGIVLSGSGSDGSLGIRSIKEEGGMIMAQDALSAQFISMPQNSVATGFVDYVLPPEEMGEELVSFIKHPYTKEHKLIAEVANDRSASDVFARVINVLNSHTGIDFSMYKENTVLRRLERRVSINRCETVSDYYSLLCESNDEKMTLCKEMLIGVTSFFRDKEAFYSLEKNVIPKLDFEHGPLRIWSAACSTGEEVYSIAILISEYMEKHNIKCDFKIFATDIERNSIEIASRGLFSENILADVPREYLIKYFIKRENNYQIRENIRNSIVFATHNILKDPAFSKLDLLVCRNLFIYLKPEMQHRLLETFYYSLKPNGFLFMGSSESVGEMTEAFSPIDTKWKIYTLKQGITFSSKAPGVPVIDSISDSVVNRNPTFNTSLAKKIKLDRVLERAIATLLPPSVLLDSNDNIVHVISSINKYIDVKPGKFTNNLLSVIPNDLSLFVSSILRRLRRGGDEELVEKITGLTNYEGEEILITGKRVEYSNIDYFLISFISEAVKPNQPHGQSIDANTLVGQRIEELEKELQVSKESLHATVEELETSNEELQSTNEELIASNEELQSTNEELQSVNEELYTVNSEYQVKIEELTFMTEDLDNLLVNAEIGALYLDSKLCIRKITPIIKMATNVVESDIGRPVSQITFMNNYPDFLADVNRVISSYQNIHREIIDEHNKTWLIRIQPYRTELHPVDGVLLSMVDTTSSTLTDLPSPLENNKKVD